MKTSFDYAAIGLENRDKRVYEALLAADKGSLRGLAAATGINRGTVYESIKKLTSLGLVSFYQTGKQRHYAAQDPTIITELIQERRRQLDTSATEATAYIASLRTIQKLSPRDSFAAFYEGDEGVAAILRDVLSVTRTLPQPEYCAISSKYVRDYLYHNFPNFTRQREKQNIFVRVIAFGQGGDKAQAAERRWIADPHGTPPNCYSIIYGNKTAFISLDGRNVPLGIVIDNAGVTAMQQALFNHMWQQL